MPTFLPPPADRSHPAGSARDETAGVVSITNWKRRRSSALDLIPVDATAVIEPDSAVLDAAVADVLRAVPSQGPTLPTPIGRTDAQRDAVRSLLDALRPENPRPT